VPNADSKRFGIVGIYNLDSGSVDWQEVLGLPFGLASSPVIFNRLPAAICAIARVYCGVAVDAFFDDFICVDKADAPITEEKNLPGGTPSQRTWPSSAQWALDKIASLIGLELEHTKHKPARSRNVLLGVEGDVSKFKTDKKISFQPTLRRRNEIIVALKECQIRKQMRPREASAFLGRLNFLLSTSYTSVGRTATQPLVDRASNRHEGKGPSRTNKHRWTHSLTHMLNFFEQLFAHLPPLVFDLTAPESGNLH